MNNGDGRNNGENNRTAVLGQYFVNCCSKLMAALLHWNDGERGICGWKMFVEDRLMRHGLE